jgi:23S rRNA (pseudouridine1915-N3)-methyltransferase
MGIRYDSDWVREADAGARFSDNEIRGRDARALLAGPTGPGTLIALEPSGVSVSSEKLSEKLVNWASRRATFVIGGPLGLDRTVLDRADHHWSLSPLTFPHEWVRALVAEQLYRALTIFRGTPYHK